MENITWSYVKPLDNSDSVKIFLRNHGVSLPDEVIQCLERYNGGRPDKKRFDTAKSREYVFQCLLSYNDGDRQSINQYYPDFEKRRLYPVAMDAAGNFICVDLEDFQILLWRHETAKCEKICDTFDKLLKMLY